MVLGDRGRLTVPFGWGSGPVEDLVIERNGASQTIPIEGQVITPAGAFVNAVLEGAPIMATVEESTHDARHLVYLDAYVPGDQ